jgi:hypothetical protein
MRPRRIFLHFLCDPVNQGTFYRDNNGVLQATNVPTPLKKSPDGWFNTQLKFSRSSTYYGLNRSNGIPLKFVDDGAFIIRNLCWKKRGAEQLIMLVILKWNPDTDVYELYYKGLIDLSKIVDLAGEGVQVNVMEGGVVQLLKAYENTVYQIPCDGSIPENIKVKLDGILFRDTFHYLGAGVDGITTTGVGGVILPAVFTGNEGDNIGIIHGDPTYEIFPDINYFTDSPNYIYSSIANITNVQIKGKIKVKRVNSGGPCQFSLTGYTSAPFQGDLISGASPSFLGSEYTFDATIGLGKNEKLFIGIGAVVGEIDVIEWSFDLIFNSRYKTTEAWAISIYDLYRLLVQNINQSASNSVQQFNYEAASQLLQQYPNLVVISGDALRASSDPTYPGPVVIKTCLKDFFDSINPVLNAALSNQTLPGQKESLFFEEKGYVFDSSVVTMDLGEVQGLKTSFATDYFFNVLKIGFPNQQYEEKAGKYEYNTTAQWASPIKTVPKEFNLVSKYRGDSNGVEWTRFSSGGRSTTYNNSDNSVFLLNIDPAAKEFDKYQAANTNIFALPSGVTDQAVVLDNISGYPFFSNNETYTVFSFSNNLATPQFTVKLSVDGLVAGTGSVAFSVWVNGVQRFSVLGNPGTLAGSNSVGGIIFQAGDTVEVKYTSILATADIFFMTLEMISEQIYIYPLKRATYDSITGLINPSTAFNIEDLTPKRMLLKHGNYLRSPLFNLIPDGLTFQTLDRNQSLSTTLAGNTITENANVPISDLDDPLFFPILFEFKTKVPLNFADVMNGAANGHIRFSFNGKTLYGFPMEVTQKPALNESQEWKLLCSPLTNVNDLVDLDIDGLNYLQLMPNDSFISHLCPVKFVPLNQVLNPQYHFIHMDDDWFINQVQFWIHKQNYFHPWQFNDEIRLQVITGGIGPVQVDLIDCSANVISSTAMNVITTDALRAPYILYELPVALSGLASIGEGAYYLVVRVNGTPVYVSEGLWVRQNWPMTLLMAYKHSKNKQSMIFSTGYNPVIRVHGWIDGFKPGAKFTVYENQPADLEMLNGIPFRSHKLNASGPAGVPDWMPDKINRITLLDTVLYDGKQYTRDGDAEWEQKETEQWPRKYWSIAIRPAQNRDGITVTGAGVDVNVAVEYFINANAFGNDPGENIMSITQED